MSVGFARRAAQAGVVALLAALAVALAGQASAGPATPNPMCPHLDTWNPRGIKGPNRIDMLIVRFPAGSASQRGGSCSILVDASYERRDWARYTEQMVEFHIKNAHSWANSRTGADLTTQVDPDFVLGPHALAESA